MTHSGHRRRGNRNGIAEAHRVEVSNVRTRTRPVAQGRAFAVRAALQLQIIAPSSPLSHLRSDLQLSDLCISLQLSAPMQAHLRSPCGVSKQSKCALAFECARRARGPAGMSAAVRRGARAALPPQISTARQSLGRSPRVKGRPRSGRLGRSSGLQLCL